MKKILSKILIGANFISIGLFVSNLNSLGMIPVCPTSLTNYQNKIDKLSKEIGEFKNKSYTEKIDGIYSEIKNNVDKNYKEVMAAEDYIKKAIEAEDKMVEELMSKYNLRNADDRKHYILESASKYTNSGMGNCLSISNWIYCLVNEDENLQSKIISSSYKKSENEHCVVKLGNYDVILDGRLVQDVFIYAKYIALIRAKKLDTGNENLKDLINSFEDDEICGSIYVANTLGLKDELFFTILKAKAKTFLNIPKKYYDKYLEINATIWPMKK